MRQWAKTAIALAASLVTLGVASGVHYVYSTEQFAEGSDGQWLADSQGFQWRLNGWSTASEWKGATSTDEPMPGAVFVLASMSVKAPVAPPSQAQCLVRLIGRDQSEWAPSGYSEDSATGACQRALASPGEAVDAVIHFEVPEVWATPDRIRGVAFAFATGFAPTPLLTTTHTG